MGAEAVVQVVRKHGTEATLKGVLDTATGPEDMVKKQNIMFARLVHILESKFGLRRGHVVSLICAAQGIPEDHHAAERHQ